MNRPTSREKFGSILQQVRNFADRHNYIRKFVVSGDVQQQGGPSPWSSYHYERDLANAANDIYYDMLKYCENRKNIPWKQLVMLLEDNGFELVKNDEARGVLSGLKKDLLNALKKRKPAQAKKLKN